MELTSFGQHLPITRFHFRPICNIMDDHCHWPLANHVDRQTDIRTDGPKDIQGRNHWQSEQVLLLLLLLFLLILQKTRKGLT